MWRNIVEPRMPQLKITAHAHYMPNTLSLPTHTRYVIHIAFPLQQWLDERASVLRYMHIACLVLTHTSLNPSSLY